MSNKYKNRPRGSQPDEYLVALRTICPNVVCPITGDSPREHLFKHGTTYALHLDHKIPYHILKRNDKELLQVVSPNGHSHYTNLQRGKTTIEQKDMEVCSHCGMNNYEYYKLTKLVVTYDTHHIDGIRSNNAPNNKERLCPNCHWATSSHSVNKEKEPFRPKLRQFLQMLHDDRSLYYISRKLKTSTSMLKWYYYKIGLDLHFGRSKISPPKCIRHLFPNQNADRFFTDNTSE
jgi:hypothetical protein